MIKAKHAKAGIRRSGGTLAASFAATITAAIAVHGHRHSLVYHPTT